MPPDSDIHGKYSYFEVSGQARFSYRKTCFDILQSDDYYATHWLSLWRRRITVGEVLTLTNSEYWTGGLAYTPNLSREPSTGVVKLHFLSLL